MSTNIPSNQRLSYRLLNIAGDLSEIAANPPNEMDSQAMARIASQLIALAGQVRLGEDIDPSRVSVETTAPTTGAAIKQRMHAELAEVPKQGGWHFWVLAENDEAEMSLCMMGPKLQAASFSIPVDSVRAAVLNQFAADMRALKT